VKRFLLHHNTTDIVNSVFFSMLIGAMLIWSGRIEFWWMYALLDVIAVAAVAVLARFAASRGQIWNLLHGFYMMLYIPLAFKQMYHLVPVIHPTDFDAALMSIDRFIFGVDVTVWLRDWSHPVITEILQLAYSSYYFLPLILAIDFYRKKRVKAFKTVFLFVIFGFYLSYLGYVAVPAIGPRFTQHEFEQTDEDLPGMLITPFLRAYTNTGESIPPNTLYPAANVQRDVFPSGHTQVTLIVILLAFRYRARTRWLLGITGTLLIIATVYLRYHYVIDLIAGGLFTWLTFELGAYIDERWTQMRVRAANRAPFTSE
jgi:membrane-associated phospholipid phosphatase